MFNLLNIFFYSGILACGMSKVWEDADGCANKYRCALAIYLMAVLSYSYGIIMNSEVKAPDNVKNVSDGLNAIDKRYFKE